MALTCQMLNHKLWDYFVVTRNGSFTVSYFKTTLLVYMRCSYTTAASVPRSELQQDKAVTARPTHHTWGISGTRTDLRAARHVCDVILFISYSLSPALDVLKR